MPLVYQEGGNAINRYSALPAIAGMQKHGAHLAPAIAQDRWNVPSRPAPIAAG